MGHKAAAVPPELVRGVWGTTPVLLQGAREKLTQTRQAGGTGKVGRPDRVGGAGRGQRRPARQHRQGCLVQTQDIWCFHTHTYTCTHEQIYTYIHTYYMHTYHICTLELLLNVIV